MVTNAIAAQTEAATSKTPSTVRMLAPNFSLAVGFVSGTGEFYLEVAEKQAGNGLHQEHAARCGLESRLRDVWVW